jgi:hypothetical protein
MFSLKMKSVNISRRNCKTHKHDIVIAPVIDDKPDNPDKPLIPDKDKVIEPLPSPPEEIYKFKKIYRIKKEFNTIKDI